MYCVMFVTSYFVLGLHIPRLPLAIIPRQSDNVVTAAFRVSELSFPGCRGIKILWLLLVHVVSFGSLTVQQPCGGSGRVTLGRHERKS